MTTCLVGVESYGSDGYPSSSFCKEMLRTACERENAAAKSRYSPDCNDEDEGSRLVVSIAMLSRPEFVVGPHDPGALHALHPPHFGADRSKYRQVGDGWPLRWQNDTGTVCLNCRGFLHARFIRDISEEPFEPRGLAAVGTDIATVLKGIVASLAKLEVVGPFAVRIDIRVLESRSGIAHLSRGSDVAQATLDFFQVDETIDCDALGRRIAGRLKAARGRGTGD